ncbi:hypothetical protein OSB04_003326 [Centaurea solstitialis]|uniref:Peptidase S8/S53 domain-containing protein n=1 Tax=Centaurea solstitialis TaxID=347529 RepID=A0AA38TUM5_9ASTR|nr:hypothetical protein OSB04_003326 [Centaurea solstitialis]
MIIGILDSGINIDHLSFHDNGGPTPSKKWKRCHTFPRKNNKVIEAVNHIGEAAGMAPLTHLDVYKRPYVFSPLVLSQKPNKIVTPKVTYFSSRGSSFESTEILKSNIIGPMVDIFAALHLGTKATFVRKSGTSMACPYLVGIVTLLKVTHPDWSPATIKSTIITTNLIKNEREVEYIDVFAVRAGFVNASKEVDRGWLYEVPSKKLDRKRNS